MACALWLGGCSALPEAPKRQAVYDLGTAAAAPASATSAAASTPATGRTPLTLAPLLPQGLLDSGTAMYYRLAYADNQQLRPYQQARWSQPPAALVQQQVLAQLGQQRAVVLQEDGPLLLPPAQAGQAGSAPPVLRLALEEFAQVFDAPQSSAGVLHLRATLVRPSGPRQLLLGQRLFTVQVPAPSADAAGGAQALRQATAQMAEALEQWLQGLVQ